MGGRLSRTDARVYRRRQPDPNALIALTRAGSRFDVEGRVGEVKAPLLYVLCDSDNLYPASAGPDAVARFKALGVDAAFHELRSPHRHRGALVDCMKWADELSAFCPLIAAEIYLDKF